MLQFVRHARRLLWASAVFSAACSAEPRTLDLYLADAPPLSMLEQNQLRGIVGEVTTKAAARAGYDLHPLAPPWPRTQHVVPDGEDLLIIPLSRTPEREAQYTWIAPVLTMDRAFFSLDKPVQTFEQARRTYTRIAVGMGSAQERKLRDEGFSDTQIYPLKIGENPARMLLLGRVDAWFNGIAESRYIWREVSDRSLSVSPSLMRSDMYLACSRHCDPAIVAAFAKAIGQLRKEGVIKRIADAYLRELSMPSLTP
jgi:polar amino acid transport system substrate-binding protein